MTTPAVLPVLHWHPTAASGNRHHHRVSLVVVHRWGVRYVDPKHEAMSYAGVVNFFANPENDASAHIVFPGSAVPNRATQMVAWSHYAWTQAAYNPSCDEIESADAIWLGHDSHGMEVLARIVACRLHARNLPPVWSHRSGFCRHADLGVAGGGHEQCPTTNLKMWRHFVRQVQAEYARGGCREWGR